MCGISGYYLLRQDEPSISKILRMTRVIAHRGPDDEGITVLWPEHTNAIDIATSDTVPGIQHLRTVDSTDTLPHRVAFGHRRFSIVDVSTSGHQPFWSRNRQVCVAFNGEIYNYVELRRELEALGHSFYTHSDTEVLAEAYLAWGTGCFKRFNGFWAVSLYDARTGGVLLSRDRIGVAPLYIAQTSEGLFWSSEIKGIFAALPASNFTVRDQSVFDFVQYGWRDLFHTTLYNEIQTFPNASYAWIQADGRCEPQAFWELPQQRRSTREISPSDAIDQLKTLLEDAVQIRLRADVPVGVELSGGMDSSAITAFAAQTNSNLEAFTVSFPGTDADEEPFARAVANFYPNRLNYNVLVPPSDDLFSQADQYIDLIEEPFHAPNLLTNQSVWREMAQRGIRVSLNGGAGDEVLAGYAAEYHPLYMKQLWQEGNFPRFVQEFFAYSEARSQPLGYIKQAYRLLPESLQRYKNPHTTPESIDAFVRPTGITVRSGQSLNLHQRLIENMGHWRMNYWMRSSNKSAMGIPVEVRYPFLDYRVVDFAFSLPIEYLIRDGWMKWILRQSTQEILPSQVTWRKVKVGFPFPFTQWLLLSKKRFFEMTGRLECPYLDWNVLYSDAYEKLAYQNPIYLWRMMSVALWWKKCILNERLM